MPLAPGRPVRSGIRVGRGLATCMERSSASCGVPQNSSSEGPREQAAIAEQEVPELEEPHAAPHPRVPAHGMAQPPVGLEERPPDRLGAELYEGFDRLHPQEHAPGWQVAGGEDLVLVVPAPHVVLDHTPAGGQSKVGRPAVRRDVQRLDLVRIVGEQLPEPAPEAAVVVLLESRDPGRHRQDAVVPQQADGLAVLRRRASLADQLQGVLVGVLHAQQEADPARLAVQREQVPVADDVVRARRSDEGQGYVLRDQRLEEALPGLAVDGRVLVREVDQLHPVLPIEPRELPGELHRVAVAPLRPEAALTAIGAGVRTAP